MLLPICHTDSCSKKIRSSTKHGLYFKHLNSFSDFWELLDGAAESASAKWASPYDISTIHHLFGVRAFAVEAPFASRIESINDFKCCYGAKSKMICTEYLLVSVEHHSPSLEF